MRQVQQETVVFGPSPAIRRLYPRLYCVFWTATIGVAVLLAMLFLKLLRAGVPLTEIPATLLLLPLVTIPAMALSLRVFRKLPHIQLTAEGVRTIDFGLLRWDEIEAVEARSSHVLLLRLRDPNAIQRRLGWQGWIFWLYRVRGGVQFSVNTLATTAPELAEAIQEQLR